jgi:predicted transcriptional regulator of viral defense system
MNYIPLTKIDKVCFSYREIARVLGIAPRSARVSANRYVRQGLLIRIKRNIYAVAERWRSSNTEEKFSVANLIQVPSYISLMTALGYYNVTTQVQRDFIESIGTRRSLEFRAGGTVLRYAKIAKKLYSGFTRKDGFFIASAEKALLDAVYLMSMGRYYFDLASIDADKLDKKKLSVMAKSFPLRVRRLLKKYGYIAKA